MKFDSTLQMLILTLKSFSLLLFQKEATPGRDTVQLRAASQRKSWQKVVETQGY
jgi:hypothetical protein